MSLNSMALRTFKQTCKIVHKSNTIDEYTGMRTTSSTEENISCRIEYVTRKFIDTNGEERLSEATIYTANEVKPFDYVDFGDNILHEVKQVKNTPDLHGRFVMYEVML